MRILYLLSHLQRSGGHGIVDFIIQNYDNIHFFNDCTPTSLKGKGPCKGIKKGQRVHAIVSFENIPPSAINNPPILRNFDYDLLLKIVLLRDPFNWWASSQADPQCRKKRKPLLWKQFAKEYLNPGDWIPINFNRWFTEEQYRKEVAERLHLKNYNLPPEQRLCKAGPGSSFQKHTRPQDLDLLNRWPKYLQLPAFRNFSGDSEVQKYANSIFGMKVNLPEMDSKKILVGPFVGEFGWELIWQAQVRNHIQTTEYEKIVVSTRPDRFFFYKDFATQFEPILTPDGKADKMQCNGPKTTKLVQEVLKKYMNHYVLFPKDRKNMKCKYLRWGQYNEDLSFDLLIHCRNRIHRKSDNWSLDNWEKVMEAFPNLSIASIGTKKAALKPKRSIDLRDMPLEKLVDIMASSKLLVGPSSGPMHLGSLCGIEHITWSPNFHVKPRYLTYWNPFGTSVHYFSTKNPSTSTVIGKINEVLKGPTFERQKRIKFL